VAEGSRNWLRCSPMKAKRMSEIPPISPDANWFMPRYVTDDDATPERPALTKITLYRCGCGSLSMSEGPCMNLSLGAHDDAQERRCAEPVEFVAGVDIVKLCEWGGAAWDHVDELRAERSCV
jgi:hypothetical protein